MRADTPGRAPERRGLTELYEDVRAATERLCAPLSPEDAVAQSMPDASPAKWHLAHTTWFFETFVLEPAFSGYLVFDPAYRVLFNSYYNTVGAQHPRPRRGLLTRPGLEEVLAYRRHVDAHLRELLVKPGAVDEPLAQVIELGLHHEQQHQELILTDVKHLLAQNPLRPACFEAAGVSRGEALPLRWHAFPGGRATIGAAGQGFAFDNERPRHDTLIEPFELASRAVTNGEFLEFVLDGGYDRPELWLSDGWTAVQRQGWRAPLYWEERDGAWELQTLAGPREVRPEEPVCHVSYYEADAFSSWAQARLPSEQEWETAAAEAPVRGNFVERGRFHPVPADEGDPRRPVQLFGDVWEWTCSSYGPYPGYRPPAGALGEYNGKFMCNQLVLRGGSCATPRSHVRASYRNFFYPDARWQFSGLRLARDPS